MTWATPFQLGDSEDTRQYVFIVALAALCLTFLLPWATAGRGKLPPGPKGLPLIGNLHQFPKVDLRITFAKWHKQYGPLVGIRLGPGKTLIVIGNHSVAKELFGSRGQTYSSRPRMVMASECMSKSMQTSLLSYGPQWKTHNKIQLSLIGSRKVRLYEEIMRHATIRVLRELEQNKDHAKTFNRYLFSIIFGLAYGLRLEDCEAEFEEILSIADSFTEALVGGQWAVDVFPVLNHLPSCVAPWKRVGEKFYTRMRAWLENNTQAALASNSWNWTKEVHTPENLRQLGPHELQHVLGVLFEAGVDSVATVLEFFVATCGSHPHVVVRAQAEIDEVVGAERLPSLDDIKNLPYVSAVIDEILRWRPIGPEGLPHQTMQDDLYRGYHIPKGATVIFSHWAAQMEEETWTDPLLFRPERWLETNANKPHTSPFGYGRRACPGNQFARMALDLIIPRLLWAFEFDVWRGENENDSFDPWEMMQGSALLKPAPFSATFKPRSAQRKPVLDESYNEATAFDLDEMLNELGKAFA
jgi:cytochrome P450